MSNRSGFRQTYGSPHAPHHQPLTVFFSPNPPLSAATHRWKSSTRNILQYLSSTSPGHVPQDVFACPHSGSEFLPDTSRTATHYHWSLSYLQEEIHCCQRPSSSTCLSPSRCSSPPPSRVTQKRPPPWKFHFTRFQCCFAGPGTRSGLLFPRLSCRRTQKADATVEGPNTVWGNGNESLFFLRHVSRCVCDTCDAYRAGQGSADSRSMHSR